MTIPRKEPPATMVASSPCSARRASASSIEVGSCQSGAVVGILVLSLLSLPRPGRLHRGDGPGLEKEDLLPDDRPLDVLRDPVLVLESSAELAELQQLLVREHAFVDDLLALELPFAVQGVMIRSNLTGDDLLPDAPDGLDDHPVAASPDRVHGEDHAGLLGVYHLLDHDGHPQIFEGALLRTIEESALGEERRPAVHDPPADFLATFDEEVGLLLTGVARGLGVLRDGGGANGHLLVAHKLVRTREPPAYEVLVGGRYSLPRWFGSRDEFLELSRGVGGRELQHPLGVDGLLENVRGNHEARGHRESLGGHAGQTGPLAAGHRHILASFLREPDDSAPLPITQSGLFSFPFVHVLRPLRPGPQSSRMATARTGAPVVPTHLMGNTESLKPYGGSWSRLVRFSRCQ